jgi:hypothetical protein
MENIFHQSYIGTAKGIPEAMFFCSAQRGVR